LKHDLRRNSDATTMKKISIRTPLSTCRRSLCRRTRRLLAVVGVIGLFNIASPANAAAIKPVVTPADREIFLVQDQQLRICSALLMCFTNATTCTKGCREIHAPNQANYLQQCFYRCQVQLNSCYRTQAPNC